MSRAHIVPGHADRELCRGMLPRYIAGAYCLNASRENGVNSIAAGEAAERTASVAIMKLLHRTRMELKENKKQA